MSTYTQEQSKAIELEGANILINAGAGSGKTTVLTQRIVNKLLKGTKISELLVLTFTNAAAKEMKERIINEVKKHEELKEQIPLVNISDIMTFDGYMLKLLQQYSYLVDLNSNVKIGDGVLLENMLDNAIDKVFNKYYEASLSKISCDEQYNHFLNESNSSQSKDGDRVSVFLNLISNYCVFTDDSLKGEIKALYFSYINVLNKEELYNNIQNDFIKSQFEAYEKMIFNYIREIEVLLLKLNLYKGDNAVRKSIEKYEEKIWDLVKIKEIDELVDFIGIFKLPSKSRSTKEEFLKVKKIQENIKRVYDKVKATLILKGKTDILEKEEKKSSLKKLILNMLEEIDFEYFQMKKKANLFEFFDVTNLVLKMLKENPFICHQLKDSYKEILIDEYQDTNDFQNEFVNLIQNNNMYLVGDVKQSIYGFRNANPQNFKKIEDSIKNGDLEGNVINLLHNFRSRDEVLGSVNAIFNSLMNDSIGLINYEDNHALLYGNKTYDIKDDSNNYFMEMLEINKEYFEEFTNAYIEPFVIGTDIKKKVENGYLVLKAGSLEKCDYSDFAILTKYKTHYSYFMQVFDFLGIPVDIQFEEKINDDENYELLVILNILRLIVNPNNKAALVSVLRSFLYTLDDQKIYNYIKNDVTCEEINDLNLKIENICKVNNVNLNILLSLIYKEFDFFHKVVYIKNVNNLNIRLMKVEEIAEDLANNGKDLIDLIEYLEYIFFNNNDENNNKFEIESEDVRTKMVKIMTIHKSKGLEFPIVYVANMGADIDKTTKNMLNLENNVLDIPLIEDYVIEESFLKVLAKQRSLVNSIDENIRLLYVGMTRAKEKIIFVDYFIDQSLNVDDFLEFKKFSHLLDEFRTSINKVFVSEEEVVNYNYDKFIEFKQKGSFKDKIEELEINDFDSNNQFKYKQHTNDFLIDEKVRSSKLVDNFLSVKEKENITIGIEIHNYLEKLDFYKITNEIYLEEYLKDVDEEHKSIVEKILNNFTKYEVLNKVSAFYTEYEFYYANEGVEVQGIIDLLLETEDSVFIVDYKFSDISKKEYMKQLTIYKKAMEIYFNKDIKCYLYSLSKDEYKEVLC